MQIEWNSKLEIGDEFIDLQHRTFVILVARSSHALEKRVPHSTLMKIFYEIKKYAEFHFVSEENFMLHVGYPGYIEHEKIHSYLLSELSAKLLETNRDERNARKVLDFLYHWLLAHIAHEDQKIMSYVLGRSDR